MLSSTKGVITHLSVKWASRRTSFNLTPSALQLVCMHVYAAGDRPFSQKAFLHCFVCTCVRSLTSSTVLGAAGALGHICLLRRGHHRHRHPAGHLLSNREEKDRGRLMLWLNYVWWLHFLSVLLLISKCVLQGLMIEKWPAVDSVMIQILFCLKVVHFGICPPHLKYPWIWFYHIKSTLQPLSCLFAHTHTHTGRGGCLHWTANPVISEQPSFKLMLTLILHD